MEPPKISAKFSLLSESRAAPRKPQRSVVKFDQAATSALLTEMLVSQPLGEVENLVIDIKMGMILAVVISSGGFLGIADTLLAVPVSSL